MRKVKEEIFSIFIFHCSFFIVFYRGSMRLAYITKDDSSNLSVWSGTAYYMNRALTGAGITTIPIGNLGEGFHFLTSRAKQLLYKAFQRRDFDRLRYPPLVRHLCRRADQALLKVESDAVFVIGGSAPFSYLQTTKPVIYWSDFTFAGWGEFIPAYDSNLPAESLRDGNLTEQLFLNKCRLAIFSTKWAADSAVKDYGLDPAKVKVVPFGANLECGRDTSMVKKITASKSFGSCKLLFIGGNWRWKGGDTALKIAEEMNNRGIKTQLDVVGCEPPGPLPDFVKRHGVLSKKTGEGRKKLDDLYSQAHFLVVPTRAECFGIVFAEASSFGLPSLAPRIGGVPSVILNGKNGQTFPVNAGPEAYCDFITRLMTDPKEYERLALSSFGEYSQRLNWKTSGEKVRDLIKGVLI